MGGGCLKEISGVEKDYANLCDILQNGLMGGLEILKIGSLKEDKQC